MAVAFLALSKCPTTLGSHQPRADFQADGVCQISVPKCSGRFLGTVSDLRAVATVFFRLFVVFGKTITSSFYQDDLQNCGLCQFLLCDSDIQKSPEEQKT